MQLASPATVMCERSGRLWIADNGNHRVIGAERDGNVHTVLEGIGDPRGLAIDAAGALLIATDADANTVRAFDVPSGNARKLAEVHAPRGAAIDEYDGWVYVAAAAARQIWRVSLDDGRVEVVAGSGADALVDGELGEAAFAAPSGIALSPDRARLYVADRDASAVRVLDLRERRVTTLAGGLAGDCEGPREHARLRSCVGVAVTPAGIAVADAGNHALRGVNPRHGSVTTIWRGSDDDALREPGGVAFDLTDRSYVVADTGNDRIVRVSRDVQRAEPLVLSR